jgi:mannobiose 2-epimerase
MMVTAPVQILTPFRTELSAELSSILDFWMKNTIDKKQGGFIGSMDNNNITDATAPKGVVLNTRILWTFSAAYQLEKNEEYLKIAARAYQYIVDHFIDRKYGGVYWSVDSKGAPLDPRKQIYGLAFCIYGLSEYYKATSENMALHLAKDLVEQIEKNSFDHKGGGYLEAFTQGWKILGDLRLSEKDDNEKKTANTHLHIIEAYVNLYTIWPDEKLKESIKHLLDIFEQYMIDPQTAHLNLFMDENWTVKSSLVSYGHDIEAAWLLLDCAKKLNCETYIIRFKELSIRLAEAAAEGLDKDGGLWYEYDAANNQLVSEKHWWPQAEAMVGFFNAYELTGKEKYLQYFINSWEFIKRYMKDNDNGEWFWGVNEDYTVMNKEKAGFWKCPYHNARACIEIFNRI